MQTSNLKAIEEAVKAADAINKPVAVATPGMGKIAYWKKSMEMIKNCQTPETLELIKQALQIWQTEELLFEKNYCRAATEVKKDFLKFHKLIEGKNNYDAIHKKTSLLLKIYCREMTVPHIGWVHAFSWIFPQVDPKESKKYREAGRMMIASLYATILKKWGQKYSFPNALTDEENLQGIESEFIHAFRK